MNLEELDRIVSKMVRDEAETAGQMTLGKFIAALEALPGSWPIRTDVGTGIERPHSYRGYYDQLSFAPGADDAVVLDVLALARGALGSSFPGYKGGEFRMTDDTMIWLAGWGDCGRRILGIAKGPDYAVVMTATDDD